MSTAVVDSVDLRFAKTERLNLAPSGKRFVCRFIEPGLISYRDVKGGVDLLRKETIDLCLETMKGAALTIDHPSKDIILSRNFADVSHGTVDKVSYDAESGAARRRIEDGEGVSCGFSVVERANGGVWHNLPYDQEDTRVEFHHLAIVPAHKKARFEDADIRLNSKSAMNLWKHIVKKLVGDKTEETARDIDLSTTIEIDGKQVSLKQMVDAERANTVHSINPDDDIEVDGIRYSCGKLIENYKAATLRANAAAEDEAKKKEEMAKKEKEDADKKERENALKKEDDEKAAVEAKAAQERENARRGAESFRTLHDASKKGGPSTEIPDYGIGVSGSIDDGVALGRERYGKPTSSTVSMSGRN